MAQGPAWSSHRGRLGEEGGEQTADGWVHVPPCHGLVCAGPQASIQVTPFMETNSTRLAGSSVMLGLVSSTGQLGFLKMDLLTLPPHLSSALS